MDQSIATSSFEPLFEEAIDAIRTCLPEDECRKFPLDTDLNTILQYLQSARSTDQEEHQRLLSYSRKFARFSHAFAPYFGVVSIFIKIKPGWAGWYWGCIQHVFQLACNHALFLKPIADMFGCIARMLPHYSQFFDTCQRLSRGTHVNELTCLLSHLYADVVQFCMRLCRVFCRESPGIRWRHRIGSIPNAVWEPLDSRFVQLQTRVAKHKQWFELEMRAQSFDVLSQHRKEYLHFLNTPEHIDDKANGDTMSGRLRRVEKTLEWLCFYDYRDIFDYTVRHRHADSCLWFLKVPQYSSWKDSPFSEKIAKDLEALKASWHNRVLFVQGKAGLGKTFLSGQIIVDLETGVQNVDNSEERPSTAFFHFSASFPNSKTTDDAFRALAAHLVYLHREDRATQDALALLVRKIELQQHATFDEVVAVLCLLLRQHPTFIVIDGLDECSDSELFLDLVPELCRNSDCRVMIISRPGITIPLQYQKWASDAPHIIQLTETHNAVDTAHFLTSNLNVMADQGYFGLNMDRSLISSIAQRPNGFLWATLLIKYLRSPGLSLSERHSVLQHAVLLDGLDPLFSSILDMLSRRFGKEKRVTADIFRWLTSSIKPLSSTALHVALSVVSGTATAGQPPPFDLAETVARLTCALVEVFDGRVGFVHRTVKEYLQSPECQNPDFSLFDESSVHAHLATTCISYLAQDVPKRPLGRLRPYQPSPNIAPSSSGYAASIAPSIAPTTSSRSSRRSRESTVPYSTGLNPTLPAPVLELPIFDPSDPMDLSGDTVAGTMASSSSVQTGRSGRSGDSGYKSLSSMETDTTGPSFDEAEYESFDARMPFLRYAALCWPIHLTRALSAIQTGSSSPRLHPHASPRLRPQPQHHGVPWLSPLTRFLTSRAAVTAWVEASWRYQLPPSLSRLIPLLLHLKSEVPPSTVEGKELRLVLHNIRELCDALRDLRDGVGFSLKGNPSLIWQWSALSAVEGGYWPIWDEGNDCVYGET